VSPERGLLMPFGKHKGLPVAELPVDYLGFLAGLDNLREPLRSAVATALGRPEPDGETEPPAASADLLGELRLAERELRRALALLERVIAGLAHAGPEDTP
jgi:hypothetical protein